MSTVSEPRLMHQVAPYPDILAALVAWLRYRRHFGWDVELADDVQRDKPGVHHGESRGLTLIVTRCGPNTYEPGGDSIELRHAVLTAAREAAAGNHAEAARHIAAARAALPSHMTVAHYFPVPPATYNWASWMRWLFDRLGDVDTHERMEDFAFEDGDEVLGEAGRDGLVRPYVPCHGPGWDPYLITIERTSADRRTSFRGELSES